MIKYLGSKRRLVPALTVLAEASGARTGLDLFCGTTRVAQAWKRLGITVTAVDSARFAHVMACCYVATDPEAVPGSRPEVADAVDRLNAVVGRAGYVTATFCEASRYFRPENGARIDAVRDVIERDFTGSALLAGTGHQSAGGGRPGRLDHRPADGLSEGMGTPGEPAASPCGCPVCSPGPAGPSEGTPVFWPARPELGEVDLAYLDPPYNQHRYDSNYHVWETIVAWDAPSHYGVACKRADLRDPDRRSAFNGKRTMPVALERVIGAVRADVVVLSYNNESWLSFDELHGLCASRGHVEVLAFDSARYVGARIGIHNPAGRKVGTISHLRNTEYMLVAGDRRRVRAMADAVVGAGLGRAVDRPVPLLRTTAGGPIPV